jgi:hypothetical protein
LKAFLNQEVIEKGKGKEILAVAETKLGQCWSHLVWPFISFRVC